MVLGACSGASGSGFEGLRAESYRTLVLRV